MRKDILIRVTDVCVRLLLFVVIVAAFVGLNSYFCWGLSSVCFAFGGLVPLCVSIVWNYKM